MSATRLDARARTDRCACSTAVPPTQVRMRQTAVQWGYLVAWFGLLFVALPFLLRPEDWREKLWISVGFLFLVVIGHVTTYTAVHAEGLTVSRWFTRTDIPWSSVTSVEVTGRLMRRVSVVSSDGTTVLPAPTSGPLNWDRRFQARAQAIQEAARRTAPHQAGDPVRIPRPRTPVDSRTRVD